MKYPNNFCPPDLHSFFEIRALVRLSDDARARREFGKSHEALATKPLKLLRAWCAANRYRLDDAERLDDTFARMHGMRTAADLLALLLGIFTAAGLLTYNGDAPVNLLYFLLFALALPLLGSLFSLIALLRSPRHHTLRLDADALLQRLFAFIVKRAIVPDNALPPDLARSAGLLHSQRLALLFSIGILVSLLLLIASTDIAFGWGTTLQLTPQTFHQWIERLALPWKAWLPDAVPSADLIAHSRFFRLGGTLDADMLTHAPVLGGWWRFLAMTLIVYAIVPRLLLWLFARYRFAHALRRAIFDLEGVPELLAQMTEPLVLTHAEATETPLSPPPHTRTAVEAHRARYNTVVGWSLHDAEVAKALKQREIFAQTLLEAGGRHSLTHDRKTLEHCRGNVLLAVKAWEPPTMDFVDFLLDLAHRTDGVDLLPLGQNGTADPSDLQIWQAKIGALHLKHTRFVA